MDVFVFYEFKSSPEGTSFQISFCFEKGMPGNFEFNNTVEIYKDIILFVRLFFHSFEWVVLGSISIHNDTCMFIIFFLPPKFKLFVKYPCLMEDGIVSTFIDK